MEVRVGPPTVTIHADDSFLVCELNGEMSSTREQGYFTADTRVVSGYRLKLAGAPPILSNSSAVAHHSARFEFTNDAVLDATGGQLPARCLHLRLDRAMGTGIHEDYDLTNYTGRPIAVDLEISIESDFADLFDVKRHQPLRRGTLQSGWSERRGRLVTEYRNGDFSRGLVIQVSKADSTPEFANGGILFRISIEPGQSWHTCLLWRPVLRDGKPEHAPAPCHNLISDAPPHRVHREWVAQATRFVTSDPSVTDIVRQAIEDLAGLRMHQHDAAAAGFHHDERRHSVDAWVPAAGVPWFVSVFGRDSLTVSFQTLALSPRFALGSLRALAAGQATEYDDERDMQPGKILHEVRYGELAALRLIPHRPYYGTHEATTLYVLVAAWAWRWHGDREALDAVRPHVEQALLWIDRDGDRDGDGLQEYQTRSSQGYYNQGWKDSGDAIVTAEGELARLPIALCEHQGLVVAAKRAWADVLEAVYGEAADAARLRADADRLAGLIETRFWWEEEGTYYLGLDGSKQPIASVASNPGHLLWASAVDAERARRVMQRLMADDMWSGWGIRTLSAQHPAYNPFSYQLGSVWPHDNAIIADGFRKYGFDGEAARVARALFDAGGQFSTHRLPELFAGLAREEIGFPVQYLGSNVPQAWAAGAAVQLLATLLGLDADASARTLCVRPALPEWLSQLRVERLAVGSASVNLCVTRGDDGSHELTVEERRGRLEVILEDGRSGG